LIQLGTDSFRFSAGSGGFGGSPLTILLMDQKSSQ
jgi:hypothetical protein